jgi:hypothetical protein
MLVAFPLPCFKPKAKSDAVEPGENSRRRTMPLLFRLAEIPFRDERGEQHLRRCSRSPARGTRPTRGHHCLRAVAALLA